MRLLFIRPMRPSLSLLGLAIQALLIVGAHSAPVTEWQAAEFNCRLNLSDGWGQLKAPNEQVKLLAQNGDGSKIIALVISEASLRGPFNKQEAIRGAKAGIGERGGSIISERDFTLGGMPAFEMVAVLPREGGQVYTRSLYAWAEGRVYVLSATGAAVDITQDPEISACLASFAFLRPPVSPSLAGGVGSGYSAYEVSKLIGEVLGWIGIIFGAIYLLRRMFRKSKPPAQ